MDFCDEILSENIMVLIYSITLHCRKQGIGLICFMHPGDEIFEILQMLLLCAYCILHATFWSKQYVLSLQYIVLNTDSDYTIYSEKMFKAIWANN